MYGTTIIHLKRQFLTAVFLFNLNKYFLLGIGYKLVIETGFKIYKWNKSEFCYHFLIYKTNKNRLYAIIL